MVSEGDQLCRAAVSNPRDRAAWSAWSDWLRERGQDKLADFAAGCPLPWYVVSPEYGETVPVLDDGSGPQEYGRDTAMVWAPDRRSAIVNGIQYWRTHYYEGRWLRRHCEGSPFAGVRAELAVCEHGRPHFDFNGGRLEFCYECKAEAEADYLTSEAGARDR